jgi:hypothetical protein
MVWQYAVAGAVIYKALSAGEMDHDETVQATYETLSREVSSHATVYADHITDGENPRGEIDGLTHVPDLIVKSGVDTNLIVEVETAASLESNPGEAESQLRDFSTSGYRRVLVIPPSESEAESVESFIENEFDAMPGKLYMATPDGVTEYL